MTTTQAYTGVPYELLLGGALGGAAACVGANPGQFVSSAGLRCAGIVVAGAYLLKMANDSMGMIPSQSGVTGTMGTVRRVGLGAIYGFAVSYGVEMAMQ